MATMNAVQSPRFEGTELHYFVGDTFTLEMPINLQKDGESVTISPTDEITLSFYKGDILMVEKTFTGIENNTIYLFWDDEFTKKFKKGGYTYRMRYNGEFVRTILADCRICVE